jgi:hypothetical protein
VGRTKEDLLKQISILEDELQRVISEKEHKFRSTWSKAKARFEEEVPLQHTALRVGLFPLCPALANPGGIDVAPDLSDGHSLRVA